MGRHWVRNTYTEIAFEMGFYGERYEAEDAQRTEAVQKGADLNRVDRTPPAGWLRTPLLDLTKYFQPNVFSIT